MRARCIVVKEGSELRQLCLCEVFLRANEFRDACVLVVVGDNFDELGEVVSIPFAYPHREQVDILVELIKESNCLDDHVVNPVDVELQLGARIGVTQAKLSFRQVIALQTYEELGGM